jgi:hypothetical protein
MVPSHGRQQPSAQASAPDRDVYGCRGRVALEVAGPVTFTGDQAGRGEELESFTVQHNEHKIILAD